MCKKSQTSYLFTIILSIQNRLQTKNIMNEAQLSQINRFSVIREPPASIIRISQEQIICEGDKTENLMQSVVCPVCLMLLQIPHYVCESCDNAFCVSCLNDWRTKQPGTCIFKCENATFKVVKRSNTYNALMELLKIKCQYCAQPIPVIAIDAHDKNCPKKIVPCTYAECDQKITRQQSKKHEQNCVFRRQACRFCRQQLLYRDLLKHQDNQCRQRQKLCPNQECGKTFKVYEEENHQTNCQFRKCTCTWCADTIYYKDKFQHQSNCKQRVYECKWCQQSFKKGNFESHVCSQIKQICQLCEEYVKVADRHSHRLDCMFNFQLKFKKTQKQLIQQNIKLKLLVQQLQSQLNDYKQNFESKKLEGISELVNEERRQYAKDLLRLDNGIQNLKKLRETEHKEHLKKPHLSQSLCPFCNSINNKLQLELAPLLRQKKQIEQKIYEADKVHSRIERLNKHNKIKDQKLD